MKRPFCLFFIIPIFLSSCNTHREILKNGQTYENFRGFVPVDPIEYDNKIIIAENGKITNKEIKLLTT